MEGGGGGFWLWHDESNPPPSVKALQYFHVSVLLSLPEDHVILQILHPPPP